MSVGGLELSRNDFVPESDSDNDDDGKLHKADAESLGKGLVEETQAYDDDDIGDAGILANSTIKPDDTPQQVVLHNLLHYNLALKGHLSPVLISK